MSIVDLVFPRICVGCGREGNYICVYCQRKLVLPEQICPMCGRPSLDGWAHPKCRTKYGMERLIVGLSYRGMVQSCLKKVKYKNAWEVMGFLYSLSNFGEVGECVLTSVPMWRQKERLRGFNQAEILVQLIAKDCKVRNLVVLERVRETMPMFGLKKEDRTENISGAFEIIGNSASLATLPKVVLVDDVWTTGATMRECAWVLKRAGVGEVWGLTLAK
jgi:competence protein ComFC